MFPLTVMQGNPRSTMCWNNGMLIRERTARERVEHSWAGECNPASQSSSKSCSVRWMAGFSLSFLKQSRICACACASCIPTLVRSNSATELPGLAGLHRCRSAAVLCHRFKWHIAYSDRLTHNTFFWFKEAAQIILAVKRLHGGFMILKVFEVPEAAASGLPADARLGHCMLTIGSRDYATHRLSCHLRDRG